MGTAFDSRVVLNNMNVCIVIIYIVRYSMKLIENKQIAKLQLNTPQ